ncbi:MAG: bifunctional phosphopantothenoylcysteine decarboxylase/phosphopantothenate--cysteine ligase CoaBC [Acidobacteriota bacterium]|nr:bifunctional phosphopantothenoylcysteine decarboxylase/phosphopantothenate--cysteine ligase CoaBC [Acidobacteriota bacterium]
MNGPNILLGVSGGIAAYKANEIVRSLVTSGASVRVVMTRRAEEFVTPLTLATLSGHPVCRSEFSAAPGPEIGHMELSRWADAILVAPATANLIARFSRGIADDLVSTVYLAFSGPVVLAPAMNPRMWDHPETRHNMERLAQRGVVVVFPEEGFLACGDEGAGRLAGVDRIASAALAAARRSTSLEGSRVLVTAGPTYEPIDPVRFVGNRSSGKMGYEIARAARARGAQVVLVSGPSREAPPWDVRVVSVDTAEQMREAVLAEACGSAPADVIVMAAAVADHRPAYRPDKISQKGRPWSLELHPTADILSELASRRSPGQLIVGFAAETGDVLDKARTKLATKRCDLLVANDVTREDAGFGVDTNVVSLVDGEGAVEEWPKMSKREVAERLLDRIHARREAQNA